MIIIILIINKIMNDFDDNYVMMMIMTMNRHDCRHPRSFNSILNFYRWVVQTCGLSASHYCLSHNMIIMIILSIVSELESFDHMID